MTTAAQKILVLLLHGVGSNGNDLSSLGHLWVGHLPEAVFVAPDAPYQSDFGSGYQWFSVAGVTESNRSERIRTARAAFDEKIIAIIQEAGFSDHLDRVVMVGFSQGTIMALDAVASGRWPIGAVVGFSGRLASPEPLAPSTSTPVLLIHGTADAVIPSSETTKAATALQGLGVSVETLLLPGVGHTISTEGADRAAAFIAGPFDTRSSQISAKRA